MLQAFLKYAPEQWRSDNDVCAGLFADILSLNGKPSIHQLERCCARARSAGHLVPTPQSLLKEYLSDLNSILARRIASIRDGTCAAHEFIVCNAMSVLEKLRAHGLNLIIISGTAQDDVRMEAALLGLSEGFWALKIVTARYIFKKGCNR